MTSHEENIVPVFRAPFSSIIVGPSQCGKSTLVENIIQHSDRIVERADDGGTGQKFDLVMIIFKTWQELYDRLQSKYQNIFFFQ